MGQNIEDGADKGFQLWYLLRFSLVLLFQMAQISFSFLNFLVMFLIGDEMAVAQVIVCFWWTVGYIKSIGHHVLATYRWLVWLFSYFKIILFQFGYIFLIELVRMEQLFTGYVISNKNKNIF